MKIVNTFLKPVLMLLIVVFCHSVQAQLLRDITNGLKEVNRTAREVQNITNTIKKTNSKSDKVSKQNTSNSDSLQSKSKTQKSTNTFSSKTNQTANSGKEAGQGSFFDKRRSKFVDNENELFYCFGKESIRYLYTEDEIKEKTMRNVLTKDKDETIFLKKLFVYHINNKRSNKQLLKCDESSLKISVFERETTGFPKKVYANYFYRDNANNLLPTEYEIQIFFEEGLPYYIWFPNDNVWPTYPHHEGAFGSLIFSDNQIGRMVRLNDRDELARRNQRQKFTNPRINDSLSTLMVKKFPGLDCSACLSRTVVSEPRQKVTEFVNGYGEKRYETKSYTDYHIKIENKCNKTIKVIGISQGFEKDEKTYGFVWRVFKPRQVIQFVRSTDDLAGGMIVSLVTGKGEVEDIDLSKINKKYDVENSEIQFLRIIEIK